MAPWEEYQYWDTPTSSFVTCPASAVTQLCARDTRRTCVILAVSAGGGSVAVSTNQNMVVGGTQGINLQPGQSPLILTQKDHGPLAQEAWYCVPLAAPQQMTVVEAFLRKWPERSISEDDIAQLKSDI